MRTKLLVLAAMFAFMASAPIMALQSSDMSDGERAETAVPDAPTNIVPSAAIVPTGRTDLYKSEFGGRRMEDAMSDPSSLFPETSKMDSESANPFQRGDTGR